jgi:broad specificity phosphatase PhoE
MPAEVPRLFVFARHAESAANVRHLVSSNPSRPVALTARGRAQARALGTQLANLHISLAVGTRLLRTQQTIGITLQDRQVPVLIEPGFDEIQAGDLDGESMESYWSWKREHTADERLPHGESLNQALWRYADALRRLVTRTEPVTLVVLHELALRHIVTAAAPSLFRLPGTEFANAVPYLFDERAVRRAADALEARATPAGPEAGPA